MPWSESFDIPVTASEIWYTDGIPGEGVLATPNLIITMTIQNIQNLCVSVTEIKGAANPSASFLGSGVATDGFGNMSVITDVKQGECFYLISVVSSSPLFGTNILTPTAPLFTINRTSNTPPSGSIIAAGAFGYNGPFTNQNISLDVNDGGSCPSFPNNCVTWGLCGVSILCCTDLDCAGVCRGSSIPDCSGLCYLPPGDPTFVVGCDGVCGSGKVLDCAGVCGGMSFIDGSGDCVNPTRKSRSESDSESEEEDEGKKDHRRKEKLCLL